MKHTQALGLLHAQSPVLPSAGAAGGWKMTAPDVQSSHRAAARHAAVPASPAHTAAPRARADRRSGTDRSAEPNHALVIDAGLLAAA